MFEYSQATSIDLSTFDTSKVEDMSYMFYEANNIEKIYVSNRFVTTKINGAYESRYMFYRCYKLVGGARTTYDENITNKDGAQIDNPPNNRGYFTYKAN